MKALAISEWAEEERPRERFCELGARSLGDAELIALLLRSGARGRSAVDLGRHLASFAKEKGGWEKISVAELEKLPGMGKAKACSVLAAVEWGRRVTGEYSPLVKSLGASHDAWKYCWERLRGRDKEGFLVVGVDAKHRPLGCELVSVGTLTQSLVHPREVFRPLIAMGAAAFVAAHNHPSGDTRPSREDHQVTKRLRQCAALFAIPLLDHVIVSSRSYTSYADSGWFGVDHEEGR